MIEATQAGNTRWAAATGESELPDHADESIDHLRHSLQSSARHRVIPLSSATASSSLPVSFASTTSTICSVSGSTVTLIATGACTIHARRSPATPPIPPRHQVNQSFRSNASESNDYSAGNALQSGPRHRALRSHCEPASRGGADELRLLAPSVCSHQFPTVDADRHRHLHDPGKRNPATPPIPPQPQ